MNDAEKRLFSSYRTLVFHEAREGDFVAMPSEHDTNFWKNNSKNSNKPRKCGVVIKKSDDVLYIKIHGSDRILEVERSKPSAASFDIPRFSYCKKNEYHKIRISCKNSSHYFVAELKVEEESKHIVLRSSSHIVVFEYSILDYLLFQNNNILIQVSKRHAIYVSCKIFWCLSPTENFKTIKQKDLKKLEMHCLFDPEVDPLDSKKQIEINSTIFSMLDK